VHLNRRETAGPAHRWISRRNLFVDPIGVGAPHGDMRASNARKDDTPSRAPRTAANAMEAVKHMKFNAVITSALSSVLTA